LSLSLSLHKKYLNIQVYYKYKIYNDARNNDFAV